MKFRKKDYIIFYLLIVTLFIINMMGPVKVDVVLAIVIGASFPALILGTITNFLFRQR